MGDKQFAAIQALENIFCPNIQQQATQAPIHPPMEPPEIDPLLQQIQQSTSVDLYHTLQELPGSNTDGHRYPTRYSLKKNSYSMACTSKYSYATEKLAKIPAHPIHFKQHMACPVNNPDTGVSLEYRHLIQGLDKDIWVKSLANDFGRLAQGVKTRMPTDNSTIFFMHPSKIPAHKKVTYGRLVVDIRPLKDEKYRVRIIVGGDKLDFVEMPHQWQPPLLQ